jgi:hypothetical protein
MKTHVRKFPQSTKKNIKVKKGNVDISITIENNLNANNKQINHNPIKRRRRKKKVENEYGVTPWIVTIQPYQWIRCNS